MKNTKKIIGLFLLLFIIIISFFIIFFQKRTIQQKSVKSSLPSQKASSSLSPTVEEKRVNFSQLRKGQLFLEKENSLLIKPNQNFTLILKANIPDENIVGFDVVFFFDQQSLTLLSAYSLLNDFALIPVKKENYLRLTVVEKPQAKQSTFLENTPVVKLTFKAKKTGIFPIKILQKVGKEKTQFINNKTEIIYPTIDEIKINVSE